MTSFHRIWKLQSKILMEPVILWYPKMAGQPYALQVLTSVHIDADSKEWQRDIIKQATCWVGCIELRPSCTAQLTLSHSIHLHGSQKMHAVITLFLRVLPSFQPRHVPKSWEEPRNKTTAPDSSYVCVMSACIYSNSLVPRLSSKEERNVWGMSLRGVWVRG